MRCVCELAGRAFKPGFVDGLCSQLRQTKELLPLKPFSVFGSFSSLVVDCAAPVQSPVVFDSTIIKHHHKRIYGAFG